MKVYSAQIVRFMQTIQIKIKYILTHEVRALVRGNRFVLPERKGYSYPISVHMFQKKHVLAYFEPEWFALGFHRQLLYAKQEVLESILRHELAHYIAFIEYGPYIQAHGWEFIAICERYGWKGDVTKASLCAEQIDQVVTMNNDAAIVRKVHKLLALTTSANRYEAELAFVKAQQLLLSHTISLREEMAVDDAEYVCLSVLCYPRYCAKLQAIMHILETFFVNVIYSSGERSVIVEVSGKLANVQVAEYIAIVLDRKLDELWELTRKEQKHLRGLRAKNSFYSGVAQGYLQRIQALERTEQETKALMLVDKELLHCKEMIYPRLNRGGRSSRGCDMHAFLMGSKMGKELQLRAALEKNAQKQLFLLE